MAKTQVFLTRHAEKVRGNPPPADPDLTPEGEARARWLGKLLKKLKVPVSAAYCSTVTRTRRTAELAIQEGALGVTAQAIAHDDWSQVVQAINAATRSDDIVLVVHHSDTVPHIFHALGADPEPGEIDDADFDQLWCISLGVTPQQHRQTTYTAMGYRPQAAAGP